MAVKIRLRRGVQIHININIAFTEYAKIDFCIAYVQNRVCVRRMAVWSRYSRDMVIVLMFIW